MNVEFDTIFNKHNRGSFLVRNANHKMMSEIRSAVIRDVPRLALYFFDFSANGAWSTATIDQHSFAMKVQFITLMFGDGDNIEEVANLGFNYMTGATLRFMATDGDNVVYPTDIEFEDKRVSVVPDERNIPLFVMEKGESINVSMHLITGLGVANERWSSFLVGGYSEIEDGVFEFSFRTRGNYSPERMLDWAIHYKRQSVTEALYDQLTPLYGILGGYMRWAGINARELLDDMSIIPLEGIGSEPTPMLTIYIFTRMLFWLYFLVFGMMIMRNPVDFHTNLIERKIYNVVSGIMAENKRARSSKEYWFDANFDHRGLLLQLFKILSLAKQIEKPYFELMPEDKEALTRFHFEMIESAPRGRVIPPGTALMACVSFLQRIADEYRVEDEASRICPSLELRSIRLKKTGIIIPSKGAINI